MTSYNTRCFLCGAHQVQIFTQRIQILVAYCHACKSDLLTEVNAIEFQVKMDKAIAEGFPGLDEETQDLFEETLVYEDD